MTVPFSPQRNPRVIIIQKLYGKLFNNEENITFPKHRFKKFIKDIVNGTIEREELINSEINNHLEQDLKIKNMTLITKSPKKVIGLDGYGIKITKQELI